MSQISTPPATPATEAPTAAPQDHATLTLELDSLLERYLHLLDQHQSLHEQLSKELSSGFFSLAQANFTAPGRVRYGQDFYDERMKAGRKVSIMPSSTKKDSPHTFRTISTPTKADKPIEEEANEVIEKQESANFKDTSANVERDLAKLSIEKDNKSQHQQLRDPLRWFGILVPPALRAAQASFAAGTATLVPDLCGVIAEMRFMEVQIDRVREQLEKGEC